MVRALVASLVAAPLLALAGPATAQEKMVHVYNWSDYVDPKMLEDFTKETGIKVVYDTYDNNEIVETKLLAGKSGYDIVVPSGPFLQRLINAGIFQKLDKSKIPNLQYVWPEVAERLQVFDPGNEHAVNYMWGTTGIGINVDKVKERLGDIPLNTWDIVLKPELSAKLKDCGIHMLDAPEDIMPGVLSYLGLNPDSKDAKDFQKAADLLVKVRGNIQKFHSSEYINALANGDICVAVGYSGDILQAKARAEEAKNGVNIAYIIPKEGALMWFDSMAIPADAPHPEEAHAFINFMMKPEVAAANSNFVAYANGNSAATELLDEEIRNDPGIYPDEATMKRLFTNTAYDERAQRTLTRLWTRVKTGR
ncbi:polyamine ABC transporter substrate-binding protein [Chelatococcus composti]|jgi:putrescine transport system substrate-binding protein|uniref:Putrescine-binding periplasmic protein n=1 Tax=Chelatococcus composti TaxID=1743235 RepID=A0A841KCS7_9HYPH|nr:polyamine ABC transporter substrate-binding protein [Chelatococcus composti]MBB6167796.1 putrescine transport system substrate-binding protein [Chelatococcus composti]MBS7735009.1 polyamine ABC transporter substrate-binding protein [Chelatococcus composti]